MVRSSTLSSLRKQKLGTLGDKLELLSHKRTDTFLEKDELSRKKNKTKYEKAKLKRLIKKHNALDSETKKLRKVIREKL